MIISNIWENKIDVPNHQPDIFCKHNERLIPTAHWADLFNLCVDDVPIQLQQPPKNHNSSTVHLATSLRNSCCDEKRRHRSTPRLLPKLTEIAAELVAYKSLQIGKKKLPEALPFQRLGRHFVPRIQCLPSSSSTGLPRGGSPQGPHGAACVKGWKEWFPNSYHIWLVVGPPLWKIWKSMGMILPKIWENKKWQPNHQPDMDCEWFW